LLRRLYTAVLAIAAAAPPRFWALPPLGERPCRRRRPSRSSWWPVARLRGIDTSLGLLARASRRFRRSAEASRARRGPSALLDRRQAGCRTADCGVGGRPSSGIAHWTRPGRARSHPGVSRVARDLPRPGADIVAYPDCWSPYRGSARTEIGRQSRCPLSVTGAGRHPRSPGGPRLRLPLPLRPRWTAPSSSS